MLLLAFALDAFAFCLLGGVVAALIVHEGKPVVPRGQLCTMPPQRVFTRLASHTMRRALDEYRDCGPNTYSEKLCNLSEKYLDVTEDAHD